MENHPTPEQILALAVKTANDKKARDITAMRVYEQTTLADYFVVMTGTSSTHIRALCDEIEFKLKNELGVYAHHIEGVTSNWILMDYTSVAINIFLSEARELYALERLWSDSQNVDLSEYLEKEEKKDEV